MSTLSVAASNQITDITSPCTSVAALALVYDIQVSYTGCVEVMSTVSVVGGETVVIGLATLSVMLVTTARITGAPVTLAVTSIAVYRRLVSSVQSFTGLCKHEHSLALTRDRGIILALAVLQ
jgi:hypothetical protein